MQIILSFIFISLTLSIQAMAITCQTSGCHEEMGKSLSKQFHLHGPLKAKNCTVCHLPTQNKSAKGHLIFKKLSAPDTNKTCYICHDEVEAALQHATSHHQVIADKSCTACHDPHKSKNPRLLKFPANTELCLKCHEKNVQANHPNHNIGKMTDGCLSCHKPHASNNKKLLKEKAPDLCARCHNKEITKGDTKLPSISSWSKLPPDQLHSPVAKGICQDCHSIHGSTSPFLIEGDYTAEAFGTKSTPASPGSVQICIECHAAPIFNTQIAKDETSFRNGSTNLHYLHLQGAKRSKSCMACHDPHGSPQGYLIKTQFSYEANLVPLKYQRSQNGGTCATMCHKNKEYNRVKAVDNGTEH